MPPMSAEGTVSRTYIDWLLSVPWKQKTKEIRDIKKAEDVLNEDHYGLEKIKDRILEHLAVRQLVKSPKGSILCFAGPPGLSLLDGKLRSTNAPAPDNLFAGSNRGTSYSRVSKIRPIRSSSRRAPSFCCAWSAAAATTITATAIVRVIVPSR